MALTDREKKLLAEMEAALATDDPGLQSTLAGKTLTQPRIATGALAALLLILGGIAILFTGLIAKITAVGVAGFLIALFGTVALLRSISRISLQGPRTPKLGATLNERWQRRQEGR